MIFSFALTTESDNSTESLSVFSTPESTLVVAASVSAGLVALLVVGTFVVAVTLCFLLRKSRSKVEAEKEMHLPGVV